MVAGGVVGSKTVVIGGAVLVVPMVVMGGRSGRLVVVEGGATLGGVVAGGRGLHWTGSNSPSGSHMRVGSLSRAVTHGAVKQVGGVTLCLKHK